MGSDGLGLWLQAEAKRVTGPFGVGGSPLTGRLSGGIGLGYRAVAAQHQLAPFGKLELTMQARFSPRGT